DGARVNFQSLQSGGASATSTAPSTTAPAAGSTATSAASEQFSFTLAGSYFPLSEFFNKVPHFVTPPRSGGPVRGRVISLNSVNLTPAASGFPQITAQITATIYTESAPSGTAGAATGGSSAAAASSTQSTSGSSSSTPAPAAAISSPVR